MNTKFDKNTIFWNVDTQYDFMREGWALPVEGAKSIEDTLTELTWYARENNIRIVNTADWHTDDDEEIDALNPDYVNTYPPHCMENTYGAEFVPATRPIKPYVIDNNLDYQTLEDSGEIVIHKQKFDVYRGNLITQNVIDYLKPKNIVIYGVATNVCVDQAVQGHLKNNVDVHVVYNAIKHLPHLDGDEQLSKDAIYEKWRKQGVKFLNSAHLLYPGETCR